MDQDRLNILSISKSAMISFSDKQLNTLRLFLEYISFEKLVQLFNYHFFQQCYQYDKIFPFSFLPDHLDLKLYFCDIALSLNSGNLRNFSTYSAKQSNSNFATSPIILKSFGAFDFTSHSNEQTET